MTSLRATRATSRGSSGSRRWWTACRPTRSCVWWWLVAMGRSCGVCLSWRSTASTSCAWLSGWCRMARATTSRGRWRGRGYRIAPCLTRRLLCSRRWCTRGSSRGWCPMTFGRWRSPSRTTGASKRSIPRRVRRRPSRSGTTRAGPLSRRSSPWPTTSPPASSRASAWASTGTAHAPPSLTRSSTSPRASRRPSRRHPGSQMSSATSARSVARAAPHRSPLWPEASRRPPAASGRSSPSPPAAAAPSSSASPPPSSPSTSPHSRGGSTSGGPPRAAPACDRPHSIRTRSSSPPRQSATARSSG
mmetsp:Transcript_49663/g.124578  ORF Transcript_49663/g.124578 Transcript_49663/m.124578 type:complete len:303 (+) Transcript_49663:467-1375(+)